MEVRMRLGIDIIEVERIKQAIECNARFQQRVYTTYEIEYSQGKKRHCYESLAGIYAVKEAFVKALGTGFREGSWLDIEVNHTPKGAPFLVLSGVFKKLYEKQQLGPICVSISHTRELAMAQIIIE